MLDFKLAPVIKDFNMLDFKLVPVIKDFHIYYKCLTNTCSNTQVCTGVTICNQNRLVYHFLFDPPCIWVESLWGDSTRLRKQFAFGMFFFVQMFEIAVKISRTHYCIHWRGE